MMKSITYYEYDWTDNSPLFNKIHRLKVAMDEGYCTLCHPHRGCNAYNKFHRKRSWKEYRKYQCKDRN